MVDLIDVNVGRIREYLEPTGEWEKTFVVFMSDNGAEGQRLEAIPVLADATVDVIRKYYNNSIHNIGNHDPFVWYGPQWASAATANRGAKSYTTDLRWVCTAVQRGSGGKTKSLRAQPGMGGDSQVDRSKPRCHF